MHCRQMRVLVCTVLFFGAAKICMAAEAEPGFKPMFNGKDLTGWRTTGNWVVEEGGVVALHPRPGESGWI